MKSFIYALTLISLLIFTSSAAKKHLTDYDEKEARVLASLAGAAYSPTPETCMQNVLPKDEQWYLSDRLDRICDVRKNTCSSYTICSGVLKRCIVVFRGTTTTSQLLRQGIRALHAPDDFYRLGKVHPYFFKALNTLWQPLKVFLRDVTFQSYDITFTGHSLGGALASLAALKTVFLNLRNSSQVRVITFGEPRIGDKKLSESFDERVKTCFRVVHASDLVPHLPPCEMDETYEQNDDTRSKPCNVMTNGSFHHGIEIWYPSGMGIGARYIECLGTPRNEDFSCSDKIKFNKPAYYAVYISDHQKYFGRHMSEFGKAGCNASWEGEPSSMSNRAVKFMSDHSSKFDFVVRAAKKVKSWFN